MLKEDVKTMFVSQLCEWELVKENFRDLGQVVATEIPWGNFKLYMTFNPKRINSTRVKIDAQSIADRKCLLCEENRPSEQQGIDWKDYTILVNPFPIFRNHLTIADRRHTDQIFTAERMGDMLDLAGELTDHTILFNGAQCGASAPDHFHFQAGDRGYMPVEREINSNTEIVYDNGSLVISAKRDYLRQALVVHSESRLTVMHATMTILDEIGRIVKCSYQPMANIVCWWQDNTWCVVVFPRRQHRPSQFFEQGDEQILLSPGVVDFGGVMVVPRKQDFERIHENKSLISNIFEQLTFTREQFEQVKARVKSAKL